MVKRQELIDEWWHQGLMGGVVLSEFSTFLARESELTFVSGANLATILVCQAAIEAHLRFEGDVAPRKMTYAVAIEASDFCTELKADLHRLRRYRNMWAHVAESQNDEKLQIYPEIVEAEQAQVAELAMRSMIKVFCHNQWV